MASRTTASAKVTLQMSATIQNTMIDGQVASGAMNANTSDSLDNGAEANQVNRGWQWKNKVLTSGSSVVIDVYDMAGQDMGAGLGRDIVGQSLAIEEIVAIKIKNENSVIAAGQLEIEPNETDGWTPIGFHTVPLGNALRGDGVTMQYQPAEQGLDVVDGSASKIKLTAVGGNVTYSIYILGRSDDAVSSSSSSSISSSSLSSSSSSVTSSSSATSSSSSQSQTSNSSTSSSTSSSATSSSSSATSSSSTSTSSSTSSSSATSSSSQSQFSI
jgi:hypothetical protein